MLSWILEKYVNLFYIFLNTAFIFLLKLGQHASSQQRGGVNAVSGPSPLTSRADNESRGGQRVTAGRELSAAPQ